MDTARAISDARLAARLTQEQLAGIARTSQATISAYESGRKRPTVATMVRLLGAAGARLTVLREGEAVLRPTEDELARRARTLRDALDLAATLPTQHHPELRYPRLPR